MNNSTNVDLSIREISLENIKETLREAGFDVDYVDSAFERDLWQAFINIEKPY